MFSVLALIFQTEKSAAKASFCWTKPVQKSAPEAERATCDSLVNLIMNCDLKAGIPKEANLVDCFNPSGPGLVIDAMLGYFLLLRDLICGCLALASLLFRLLTFGSD